MHIKSVGFKDMAEEQIEELLNFCCHALNVATNYGDDDVATETEEKVAALIVYVGLGKDEPTVLPRFDTRTGRLYRDVLGKTIPMQTINPANYVMLEKMARLANGRFYRALDQAQLWHGRARARGHHQNGIGVG